MQFENILFKFLLTRFCYLCPGERLKLKTRILLKMYIQFQMLEEVRDTSCYILPTKF